MAGRRRLAPLLLTGVVLVVGVAVALGTTMGGQRPGASSSAASASLRIPPPVAPTGWRTAWLDDFDGVLDTNRWFRYSGQPEDGPGAWWEPSHIGVADGLLALSAFGETARGGQLVSAGLNSSLGESHAYGRYLVRMKVDAARDVAFAVLLVSPGAADGDYVIIASDSGGDRTRITAGLRGRSLSGAPVEVTRSSEVDLTQWKTIGVEWKPGRLQFTVDGKAWSQIDSPFVPKGPLALAVQTQAVCTGAPCPARPGATTGLFVDWVSAQTSLSQR